MRVGSKKLIEEKTHGCEYAVCKSAVCECFVVSLPISLTGLLSQAKTGQLTMSENLLSYSSAQTMSRVFTPPGAHGIDAYPAGFLAMILVR